MARKWTIILFVLFTGLGLFARGGWDDPPAGWDYMYEAGAGEAAYHFTAGGVSSNLLEGSWLGGRETFFWDGSIPGDFAPANKAGEAPGGLQLLTLKNLGEDGGDTRVLSMEVAGDTTIETGNPFNFAWDSPANEAIYFYRATLLPGSETTTGSVNKGMTLIARWRLKPNPVDVETPAGQSWNGCGFIDDGKGIISIVDQDDINASLSYTDGGKLVLMEDHELNFTGDPTEFITTWLCVAETAPDTFFVEVYLNGSTTPAFSQEVTDPPHGDETGTTPDDYIAFGLPVKGEAAAMELDYIGYKVGFLRPGDKVVPPRRLAETLDKTTDPAVLTLDWTIPEGITYDSIKILKNNALLEEIAGTEITYSTTDIDLGHQVFSVVAVIGANESFPTSIMINNSPSLNAKISIDYQSDPNAAVITWDQINAPIIDTVEISRGGEKLADLPVTTTEYRDQSLTPLDGEVTYQLTLMANGVAMTDPHSTSKIAMFGNDLPYLDPEGGWDYVYNPDDHDPANHPMDQYVEEKGVEGALDGTWIRSEKTDYWDGSAPGQFTLPTDPSPLAPGGIEIRERPGEGLEGGTIKTLSIEDAGDPRKDDYKDPCNRKIYLAHVFDPLQTPSIGGRFAKGMTMYVRFRLTPDPEDIDDAPKGVATRDSSRGQITLVYYDGSPDDADADEQSKSWAMSLYHDKLDISDGGDIYGLNPGQWVSVWVTLEDADGSGYYHNHLFMNGNTDPIRPDWRSQLDSWEETIYKDQTIPFTALCMGMLNTTDHGAIEIDFIKVKYGEYFPESGFNPAKVQNLTCTAQGSNADLSWTNGDAYDSIQVMRGETILAEIPGTSTSYTFEDLADGTYSYSVFGLKDLIRSEGVDCTVTIIPSTGELFIRGEVNQDGKINLADAITLLTFLFSGGETLKCLDAADTNDDGKLNLADAISLLTYLFAGGSDLPVPHDVCGSDQVDDDLPTCVFVPCQ